MRNFFIKIYSVSTIAIATIIARNYCSQCCYYHASQNLNLYLNYQDQIFQAYLQSSKNITIIGFNTTIAVTIMGTFFTMVNFINLNYYYYSKTTIIQVVITMVITVIKIRDSTFLNYFITTSTIAYFKTFTIIRFTKFTIAFKITSIIKIANNGAKMVHWG